MTELGQTVKSWIERVHDESERGGMMCRALRTRSSLGPDWLQAVRQVRRLQGNPLVYLRLHLPQSPPCFSR